ncbi:MAG: hypothetical protein ABEI86_13670, partial [Halobacteriaceae archaeon]
HVIPTKPEGKRDLISTYKEDIRNRLDLWENDIDRVDQKVGKVSSNVHDAISLESTRENVSLQREIRRLTWALLILTAVLVLIEINRVGIIS